MATIYRVQDKDGRGPFKPDFSHKWVRQRPDHINLKPMMMYEEKQEGLHYGLGCLSPKELRRWFTPTEFMTLRSYGYQCKKLEGATIIQGDETQVLFSRKIPHNKKNINVRLYQ